MELKRRALGKGLSALIPGNREDGSGEKNTVLLSEVSLNPMQPRGVFSDAGIEKLAESIRRKGVLQPLVVRRSLSGGYQLIAGERRLRAAKRAGLERVPVVVRDASDSELLEIALIENIQREDLNALEEAAAFKRLMDEFALTQEQLAEKVGKDRSTVANALRLLQLPAEVKEQIVRGALSGGHARAIVAAGSPLDQVIIARDVVARRLSVRDTEKLVRGRLRRSVDHDHRAIEEQLTRALGTKVKVHLSPKGRGRIEVQFYSVAELNGLIDRLAGRLPAATNF